MKFIIHIALSALSDKLLDVGIQRLFSQAEDNYTNFLQLLSDEAKEGPRLFSLVPVGRSAYNPKQWASTRFRLILWCEHSRLPVPILYGKNSKNGIYEFERTREWFTEVAPFLKIINTTISLVLPIAASGVKLVMDEKTYQALEKYLDFGKDVIDASLSSSEKIREGIIKGKVTDLTHGIALCAEGVILREFHALLSDLDPVRKYGGLVRVMNNHGKFLWVHEQFAGEY